MDARSSEAIQREAFGKLIEHGVYSVDFEHSSAAHSFFRDCIFEALKSIGRPETLSVLECGCGTGAWLRVLAETVQIAGCATCQFYGFDLTPGMVEIARQKLAPRIPVYHLRVGSVLDDDSYIFDRDDGSFNLIYAYDLIQQLPPVNQSCGCEAMLKRLTPGGVLVIFDHERRSAYGINMDVKKFLTRRFHLNLVPRFYCNARYPSLRSLSRQLTRSGFRTQIRTQPRGTKQALIVWERVHSVT